MSEQTVMREMFEKHGGVMKTKELAEQGIYYKKLHKLIDAGEVEQVKHGFYQYVYTENYSEIAVISKLFPEVVICMESAADIYGYTQRTPSAWHLAVPSKSSRRKYDIDYPTIKVHFVDETKFYTGIDEINVEGTKIKVYDRERTVCDFLLHRNKIDPEVFNETIRSYLNDTNKRTAVLAEYGTKLHVAKKIKEVIGIWL